MTKSVDWAMLLASAAELDKPLTDEQLSLWKRGLIDGNAYSWNTEYVDAAQAAIEKHDPRKLYAMMRAQIPIPAFLLPLIADLSEPTGRRPAAFTAYEDQLIREQFDRMVALRLQNPIAARKKIAAQRGVGVPRMRRCETSYATRHNPPIDPRRGGPSRAQDSADGHQGESD